MNSVKKEIKRKDDVLKGETKVVAKGRKEAAHLAEKRERQNNKPQRSKQNKNLPVSRKDRNEEDRRRRDLEKAEQ